MTRNPQLFAWLLICTLIGPTAGCTSMKTMPLATPPSTPPFPSIRAGDIVEVETRDGRRTRFIVLRIDGDTLLSEDGNHYRRDEIVRLQRQSFSGWKTALLVGAVVYGAVYTLFALLFTGAL